MTFFSRAAGTMALAGLLVAPLPTFAATSQQLLDQAFKSLSVQKNSVQGTVDFSKKEVPLRKYDVASTQTARIGLSVEKPLTATSTQGFFEVQSFNETTGKETTQPLPSPLRLSFRDTEGQTYLRLENVAALLAVAGMNGLGSEQLSTFDRWYVMDLNGSDRSFFLPLDAASIASADDIAEFKRLLAVATAKKVSPYQVISTSAVAKQPNVRRIQFRINPALINLAQQEELKAAKNDAAKRKQINADYTALRASIKTLTLAANVNAADAKNPSIDRLEFFASEAKVEQGCGYKTYDKKGQPNTNSFSCTINTHRVTTELRGGLNFTRKADVTVSAPADAGSLKEALTQALNYFLGSAFDETPASLTTKNENAL